MNDFFFGALAMGCFVIGLFFLRYWRFCRDRLFLFFFLAFWLFAIEWTVAAGSRSENSPREYWIRLVSFSLIIVGILDKNRRAAG